MRDETTPFFLFRFILLPLRQLTGRGLLVVLGLRREVSRTVVVRYWYVHVEVEGHVDGHFRRGLFGRMPWLRLRRPGFGRHLQPGFRQFRWFVFGRCRRPRFGRHGLSAFIDRRFSRSRLLRRLRARSFRRGCGRLALSHTVADCASVV